MNNLDLIFLNFSYKNIIKEEEEYVLIIRINSGSNIF
jgi:hypothetical protein